MLPSVEATSAMIESTRLSASVSKASERVAASWDRGTPVGSGAVKPEGSVIGTVRDGIPRLKTGNSGVVGTMVEIAAGRDDKADSIIDSVGGTVGSSVIAVRRPERSVGRLIEGVGTGKDSISNGVRAGRREVGAGIEASVGRASVSET